MQQIMTKLGVPPSPTNYISLCAALIAVIAAGYTALHRPPTGRPAVAFVDFAAVMEQSDAGKSLNKQIAPKQQALQKEAQTKADELKKEQADLNKQRDSMAPDKVVEANADIQKKLVDWNTEAQKRDATLKNAATPAVQAIQKALRDQLVAIATENNFSAILPIQDAFYANKDLNVTSEAIRRMNRELPQVEVKFDEDK